MMRKNFLKVISLILIGIIIFTSCKGKEEEEIKEFVFLEDSVFEVNGEQVSVGEWNLYAQPVLEETQLLYGDDIWGYQMDGSGTMFGETLQEDIQRKIVNVKVVAGHAEAFGVSLSGDDRMEIAVSAEEYLEKLSEKEKEDYGITKEKVEKVFTDNLLATKVYEYLILNVDTEVDETEVRHMDLSYIVKPKTYEDRDGNTCFYTDEEINKKRNELEEIRKKASQSKDVGLKDFENEENAVMDIISDYEDLKEMLPLEMAGIVFWLRQGEVSAVLESDEAMFLFECVNLQDEAATKAARIRIIEQREQEVFEENYLKWKENVEIENNPSIWKSITDRINAYGKK